MLGPVLLHLGEQPGVQHRGICCRRAVGSAQHAERQLRLQQRRDSRRQHYVGSGGRSPTQFLMKKTCTLAEGGMGGRTWSTMGATWYLGEPKLRQYAHARSLWETSSLALSGAPGMAEVEAQERGRVTDGTKVSLMRGAGVTAIAIMRCCKVRWPARMPLAPFALNTELCKEGGLMCIRSVTGRVAGLRA